ncbi:pre-mRNA branch site protein [Niveomyces insectorum RCEF 264]|uniref:Pre-mRNA branch site protein n=1 Tax=Niveomyces insectorum RCEF 264 TaxID=1081102 RepID=A0A167U421_9HYPO|nr:pre-mRNA branch site protein [Niveomyces insectorum RCEF 264]
MSRASKLAPEVNRYNVTPEELFELFGKFGPIRQVRQGIATNTKGTAFVVYEDVMDAKQACDKLNGFNFQNRYLVAREDGQVKRGPRGPQGEFSAAQETARHRLTIRRACDPPADDNQTASVVAPRRPVFSIHPRTAADDGTVGVLRAPAGQSAVVHDHQPTGVLEYGYDDESDSEIDDKIHLAVNVAAVTAVAVAVDAKKKCRVAQPNRQAHLHRPCARRDAAFCAQAPPHRGRSFLNVPMYARPCETFQLKGRTCETGK